MIDHISKILEDAELNNEKLNLAGYKWKSKGILFEVFEHDNEKIKVRSFWRRTWNGHS